MPSTSPDRPRQTRGPGIRRAEARRRRTPSGAKHSGNSGSTSRGRRRSFDLPLDLGTATPFRTRVLEELRKIPFGETASYGEIGRRIGSGSPRAVGQAVGRNPLSIIIPCHRVVTTAGRLGGFSSGLPRKVALLRLEGIPVSGETFSSRIGG